MSPLPGPPALSPAELQDAIARHARYSLCKAAPDISARDLFEAVALTVRDRLVEGMLETEHRYEQLDAKRLYYLSIEFLIGRSLRNNLTKVDHEGEVLDMLVQPRRDSERCRWHLWHGLARCIGRAVLASANQQGLRKNNRAENSHQAVRPREREMQRLKFGLS